MKKKEQRETRGKSKKLFFSYGGKLALNEKVILIFRNRYLWGRQKNVNFEFMRL